MVACVLVCCFLGFCMCVHASAFFQCVFVVMVFVINAGEGLDASATEHTWSTALVDGLKKQLTYFASLETAELDASAFMWQCDVCTQMVQGAEARGGGADCLVQRGFPRHSS